MRWWGPRNWDGLVNVSGWRSFKAWIWSCSVGYNNDVRAIMLKESWIDWVVAMRVSREKKDGFFLCCCFCFCFWFLDELVNSDRFLLLFPFDVVAIGTSWGSSKVGGIVVEDLPSSFSSSSSSSPIWEDEEEVSQFSTLFLLFLDEGNFFLLSLFISIKNNDKIVSTFGFSFTISSFISSWSVFCSQSSSSLFFFFFFFLFFEDLLVGSSLQL